MIEIGSLIKCILKPKKGKRLYINGKRKRMFFRCDGGVELLKPVAEKQHVTIEYRCLK
jgi:hypothetical protein